MEREEHCLLRTIAPGGGQNLNHVLLREQWYFYGAALISGYTAASGMAGEYGTLMK
jgi:hypothetical protein